MRRAIVLFVALGFLAAALADGCRRDPREDLPTGTVIPGETPMRTQAPKATLTPDQNATPFPTDFYSDSMGEYS